MTTPNPFETFAERYSLSMTAVSVPFRPGIAGDSWDESALHFACEIKTQDGRIFWRGFYSVGSAFPLIWAKEAKPGKTGEVAEHVRAALTQAGITGPIAWKRISELPHIPFRGRESIEDARLRESVTAAFKRAAPLCLADILESLSFDWKSVMRAESFEEWAEDIGADPDSRKTESMYRECQIGAQIARAAIGLKAFEEFLHIEPE